MYIIQAETSGRYYVGQTENLHQRISDHNAGKSRYTAGKGPWPLVYYEEFHSRAESIARESEVKRWKSRKMIQKLVNASQGASRF